MADTKPSERRAECEQTPVIQTVMPSDSLKCLSVTPGSLNPRNNHVCESPSTVGEDALTAVGAAGPVHTSTPTIPQKSHDFQHAVSPCDNTFRTLYYCRTDSESSSVTCVSEEKSEVIENDENGNVDGVLVPILGYETIEERAKFTVYKLEVRRSPSECWFIFRRYSDFQRLRKQLRQILPNVRLSLPPKKWLGDNFEKKFLEDRKTRLQSFINKILSNKDICNSEPVRQFFCFDEPPGPYESLEESRAKCKSLEDQVFGLGIYLQKKEERILELERELDIKRKQITDMESSCSCQRKTSASSSRSRETEPDKNLSQQL